MISLSLSACRNDMEKVRFFDRKDLPQQKLDSVRAIRSANGKMQMLLTAPTITIFDKPEKKTVYPDGVEMHVLDGEDKAVADIRADYAFSLDEKHIIEARNNVVIFDHRTGDTTYLRSIVWNSAEHRVFSNDSVRSVNGQRVTIGDGFESDDNFTSPVILHQRGTIQIDN